MKRGLTLAVVLVCLGCATLVSDGKACTTYLPQWNAYTVQEPADVDAVLKGEGEGGMEQYMLAAIHSPGLRTATSDDPAKVLAPIMDKVSYAGQEELGGT